MRLVIHIQGENRPTAFEQDVAVLNIWCDMVLANIELGSPEVAEVADGGWDLSMECLGLTSFPVRLITEENLGDWLGSHETELSILGTAPADDDYDWLEASDGATAAFWDGEAEIGRCTRCRLVIRSR